MSLETENFANLAYWQSVDMTAIRRPEANNFSSALRNAAFDELKAFVIGNAQGYEPIEMQTDAGVLLYARDVKEGAVVRMDEVTAIVESQELEEIDFDSVPTFVNRILLVAKYNDRVEDSLWYRANLNVLSDEDSVRQKSKSQVSGPAIESGKWAQETRSTGKIALKSHIPVGLWVPVTL